MTTNSSAVPSRPVIADVIADSHSHGRDVALVAGFTLAIAIGAQVAMPLPFTPVPLTAQTFVVLLGAAVLGPRRAAAGATAYAFLGATGVPWFAVTSGATIGYLIGFAFAAGFVGWTATRGWLHGWARTAASLTIGSLVILLMGTVGLALVLGLGVQEAFSMGFAPFVVGDLLKVLVATLMLPMASRRLVP